MRTTGLILSVALALAGCGGGSSPPAPSPSPTPSPSPSPTPSPSPSPTPAPAAGGEVFALADPGETAASMQRYLAMSEVDGIAFRARWRDLEPQDGSYDWSQLDNALAAAAAAGKKITIHIGGSGGAWPQWLEAAGAQIYSGPSLLGGTITDPVPWDSTYLSRYARLMQQLANHVGARGQSAIVRLVSVGAPVSEMSLVACSSGVVGAAPKSVVYSRSSYVAAWRTTGEAVTSAFPATAVAVSAPVAEICRPDGDGLAFYGDVMAQLPGVAVFAADLTAQGSQRHGQVATALRSRPLFLQTISAATGADAARMQGTLSSAVCQGRTLGARYFEIYKADLDSGDAATATALRQARGLAPCP